MGSRLLSGTAIFYILNSRFVYDWSLQLTAKF